MLYFCILILKIKICSCNLYMNSLEMEKVVLTFIDNHTQQNCKSTNYIV